MFEEYWAAIVMILAALVVCGPIAGFFVIELGGFRLDANQSTQEIESDLSDSVEGDPECTGGVLGFLEALLSG